MVLKIHLGLRFVANVEHRLPDNRHLVALPGDRGVVAAIYRKNQHTKKSLQLEIPDIDHQLQLAPP